MNREQMLAALLSIEKELQARAEDKSKVEQRRDVYGTLRMLSFVIGDVEALDH